MDEDGLKNLSKEQISAVSKKLTNADAAFLISMLTEKDDKIRYNAFLLLQTFSKESPFVYDHWGVLEEKLTSDNSYQRSIGVMLLAENVRWDKQNHFSKAIDKYLGCCNDEKFITARQAIQGLQTIVKTNGKYNQEIKQGLAKLELSQYKENQQSLLNRDITSVLKEIEKSHDKT